MGELKINNIMKTQTNQIAVEKLRLLLKYTYAIVPIAAGTDKFLNLLTRWDSYISPAMEKMLPVSPSVFMMLIGIIEIIAGIIVLIKTQPGAYIVSAWLICIALSLLFTGNHLDVAVRDIVMAIGAYVLARLSPVSLELSKP